MMKVSKKGAEWIHGNEGLFLKWYLDPVDVPTIGYGFTMLSKTFRKWWTENRPGVEFKKGVSITKEEALEISSLIFSEEYGAAVNRHLENKKVPQHIFDAMASACFNMGPGSLKWKWGQAAKRGDYKEAARLIQTVGITGRNPKTGKRRKLAGLVRRRKEEANLMLTGEYPSRGSSAKKTRKKNPNTLERGDKGYKVGQLLEDLHELGFYKANPDDRFGPKAEEAVKAFQEASGLVVDGKAGPKTLALIQKQASSEPVAENDKPLVSNPHSKILPLYRPRQSDEITKLVFEKFAGLTPESRHDDRVKVLVVRGYYQDSMGAKGRNDRKLYDDAIFVMSPEGIQTFNGNSDPSVYRKRVATIKAPQAIKYRPGLHGYSRRGGPYPAFRQDANATVIRDKVGEDYGMFHVNFHRGGVKGTSSLGCLTVPPHQWNEFYKLVKGLLERYNQETFYTTLVEYAGDNPPVTIPKKEEKSELPVKTTAVAGIAVIAAVSGWWDKLTMWLGF